MILDKRTQFCDATALNTGAAGGYLIGDVLDLGTSNTNYLQNAGNGTPVYLVITVATTATSGGSATGQFQLWTSDATDGTGNANALMASYAWPVASMTAGTTLLVVALPGNGLTYRRYLQIRQVTGTAAFTTGAINAFLTLDAAQWMAYADAPAIA